VNGGTFLKNWLFLSESEFALLTPMKRRQLFPCEIRKIDAFQESWDKSPGTKGSKKLKKSKKRCLSRFMGQEPRDERQQKAREIQKAMPFKNCRT